ncbi:hypothetical protein ENBRE01_2627 [Enteropsectra breve]|nr:hypothetical protein ENBRE01_2627 [Enteropsectra breve]
MARSKRITTSAEKEEIIKYLREKVTPPNLTGNAKQNFKRFASSIILEQGVLYVVKEGQIVRFFADSEASDKELFIAAAHGHSHIGVKKMESFIFANACGISRKEIRNYVAGCRVCQASTPYTTLPPVNPIVETAKLERFIADAIDMQAYSEYNDGIKWIINVVDSYSKFAWSFRTADKRSDTLARLFKSLFYNEGAPKILHCDNGLEFKNSNIDQVCMEFNICRVYGRARHPQSQGQVERFNQTLKRRLAKATASTPRWIDMHDRVVYEYNTSIHSASNETPFKLHKGTTGIRSIVYTFKNEDVVFSEDDPTGLHRMNYIERLKRTSNYNPNDICVG